MRQIIIITLFLSLISCSNKKKSEQLIFVSNQKINKYLSNAQDETILHENRMKFSDSAYAELQQKSNDSTLRRNHFKVANRYFSLYELEKYKTVTQEALELGKSSKDSSTIAKALYYLGDYHFEKARNDSAYWYYNKAEKIYLKTDDKVNLINTILYKAYILLYEKDFMGSETATIKALDLSNEIKDDVLIYECYVNLGSSLLGLDNYDRALYYHSKALIQIDKLKKNPFYDVFKAQTFNNLGLVYQKNKQYEKAIENFSKGLAVKNLIRLHPTIYSALMDNLGYSKFKLERIDAYEELNKSLLIRDSIGNIAGIIKSKIHLSEYYLSKANISKALEFNNEANELAIKSSYNSEVLTTLDLYTKIIPKKGLYYAKKYIKLSDSLYDLERATRNKLARIEFETDEIIHENEVISSENKRIITIAVLVVLFVALLYIILFQRSRQKELILIQDQQKTNEEIYQLMLDQQVKLDEVKHIEKNRIARELHDGIMNKLASTRLNLYILTRRTDEETIQKCIGHVNEIQNIEKEVRAIAHELSNDVFSEKSNFKTILTELLIDQQNLYSPDCVYSIDKEVQWDTFDVEIKMHIYRILQEALNNCNKYANAKTINVSIVKQEKIVTLQIRDDGDGFNVSKAKKGIGIKNMLQRSTAVNGELNIESEIGKGTTLFLKIPIK